MMPKKPKISSTALTLLTLLHNVNDLIVVSSDRTNARDVMKALRVYAHGKSFPLSDEKIDNFNAVLIDSKPFTLTSLLQDIAHDVMASDYTMQKKNNPKKILV